MSEILLHFVTINGIFTVVTLTAQKRSDLYRITRLRFDFCLFRSEFELKDICMSVCNNSCIASQNGNEDSTATIQTKSKTPQNHRHSGQNHRYHRPQVMTDEEYSDSSGGLYNDYVSSNSVSVKKTNTVFILFQGLHYFVSRAFEGLL